MIEILRGSLVLKDTRSNKLALYLGALGGILSQLIGGFDVLAESLLYLMIVDVVTGVLGGVKEKKLDSQEIYWGVIRKIVMFSVVGLAFHMQSLFPTTLVLRETVMYFYLSKEGLSVIENIGKVVELPPILTQFFQRLTHEQKQKEERDE